MKAINREPAWHAQEVLNKINSSNLLDAVRVYEKVKSRKSNPYEFYELTIQGKDCSRCSYCKSNINRSYRYFFSMMGHYRTAKHISAVYGVKKTDLLKVYNLIKQLNGFESELDTQTFLIDLVNNCLSSCIEPNQTAMTHERFLDPIVEFVFFQFVGLTYPIELPGHNG